MDKATAKIEMEKYAEKLKKLDRLEPFWDLICNLSIGLALGGLFLTYFNLSFVENALVLDFVSLKIDNLHTRQVIGILTLLLQWVITIVLIIIRILDKIYLKKRDQAAKYYFRENV